MASVRFRLRPALRGLDAAILIGAGLVGLFYLNRILTPWPLYAGDEGAYLIRALYGDVLAAHPERHPTLQPVGNTAYLLLIRLTQNLTDNLLPWLRLIGAAGYVGGLWILHRAVRSSQAPQVAGWVLLAALAYPFHRFVVTAMPEGVFVFVLAAMAAASALWAVSRPWAHAVLMGAMCALLVLIKPHGLTMVPAMTALLIALVAVRVRQPLTALTQLGVFVAVFLVTGAGIEFLGGRPEAALTFFMGSAYGDHFGRVPDQPVRTAAITLLSLGSATLLLAGAPLVAGSLAVAQRWRRREPLGRDEMAFVLLAAAFLAALAMILVFAVKVSAIPGESGRLWGRYFEFYVPLLWIAAGGSLAGFWRGAAWPRRLLLAAMPMAGLLGLLVAWRLGVLLNPWDSGALSAFYLPHLDRWGFVPPAPYLLLSAGAVSALSLALCLGCDLLRAWAATFVALGLISTHYDDAWVGREIAGPRAALQQDLHVARGSKPTDSLPVVLAYDHNASHMAFMAYDGEAQILVRPPGPVPPDLLEGGSQVIAIGGEPLPPPWRVTYAGEALRIYQREGAVP
ncbi:hypothetical protein [Phenylobacterium sp.]|uniref:hypothetical protein n=1 Tax=Phenylobacterium sp. TaxID=1871053 RepID=UPI00272F9A32|nr:hypothetical protein [Phenylobacterium sp.]MDP1616089.1 hypothetical protein [Phenylobacterium sp.]MDP1987117.1 hypothetical protein [Phenylobacterium sp.]